MAKLRFLKPEEENSKIVKLNSSYSKLRKQLNISITINLLQLFLILCLLCRK